MTPKPHIERAGWMAQHPLTGKLVEVRTAEWCRDLEEQLEALHKVARDLYDDAGVDDIDQRLDYLMVQIGREVWNDFVAHLTDGSYPATRPDYPCDCGPDEYCASDECHGAVSDPASRSDDA